MDNTSSMYSNNSVCPGSFVYPCLNKAKKRKKEFMPLTLRCFLSMLANTRKNLVDWHIAAARARRAR